MRFSKALSVRSIIVAGKPCSDTRLSWRIVRLERKAKSSVTLALEKLAKLTDTIDKLKKINEGIELEKKWGFRTC